MIHIQLRRWLTLVLLTLVLMLGIGAGIVLDRQALVATAAAGDVAGDGPDLQLIAEAWSKIQANFVDRPAIQSKPMTYGALSGMVSALGDTGHTTFLTPEMVKAERNYTQGAFEGIGAQVQSKDGYVVIVAPFDGSPAQKAGLRAGDAILKVNGKDMAGVAQEQVIGQILGPAGTPVTLTIRTKAGQVSEMTVVRARIAVNNVTWQKLPGTNIAHLRLAGFSQNVSRDLREALLAMQAQGVTGVILDLRNNPGGLLTEAVSTASQFLSSGDVMLEKDAQGTLTRLRVRTGGVATQIPLAVLINNGSASASEIVAGALQDAKRAILIGETTFGTGTVLQEFALSDGSALMLAVQEWLTPNGRVIWHKGIVPDHTVTLAANVNPLTPEGEREMTVEQLQASDDQQLLRAVESFKRSAQNETAWQAANGSASTDLFAVPLALECSLLQPLALV